MKIRTILLISFCIAVAVIVGTIYAAEPNEPNEPVRQIVMPKDTKLPAVYKCPTHGLIGESILTIEIEGESHIFCKKCAMKFLVDVFKLNLPKLEKVQ